MSKLRKEVTYVQWVDSYYFLIRCPGLSITGMSIFVDPRATVRSLIFLQKNDAWFALILFVIAYLPRLMIVDHLSVKPAGDYLAYHTMALNLLEGRGLTDIFGNQAYYNPGYPLFVLVPTYLLFGPDYNVAQIFNAALGGLSAVLVFLLAKRVLASRGWALFAGLMFATNVESIVYCEYLAKENLTVPLILIALLLAIRASTDERAYPWLLGSGVFAGTATLVGTSSLYLLPVITLLAWLRNSSPKRWLGAAVVVIGFALSIAPMMFRNHMLFGEPILSTSDGFNLYLGNNPNATGRFVSISDTAMAERWHEARREGEVVANREMRKAALQHIFAHPFGTFGLTLKKVVLLWTPPIHNLDSEGVPTAEYVMRVLWFNQYCFLALGSLHCLIAAMIERDRSIPLLSLWLTILGFTGIHAVVYVILRYRIPMTPLLIVLCCYGLRDAFTRLQTRMGRRRGRSLTGA